jgi:NADH-quinone oxidoreductase subunit J
MEMTAYLFYPLAFILIYFASMVVLKTNPIFSSLYLALTMIGLAFVFFLLKSFFIAGVQLIVYAGAVIVLFVMVLMMFDVKKDDDSFLKSSLSAFFKVIVTGLIGGLIIGTVMLSLSTIKSLPSFNQYNGKEMTVTMIADVLFTKYVFAFEALGVLLLVVAIGAVVISRVKGGTHAKS